MPPLVGQFVRTLRALGAQAGVPVAAPLVNEVSQALRPGALEAYMASRAAEETELDSADQMLSWPAAASGPPAGPTPGGWSFSTMPVPEGTYGPSLNPWASCGTDVCVTAGQYLESAGGSHGAVLDSHEALWTFAEGSWAVTPLQLPTTVWLDPQTLSCGARLCAVEANGWYGRPGLVFLVWNSGTWSATVPPLPADAATGALPSASAFTCGGGLCAASGPYRTTREGWRQALWVTSGAGWEVTEAPLPPDASTTAPLPSSSQVSCGGETCTVTGAYRDGAGDKLASQVLWVWAGAQWAAAEAPTLDGSLGSAGYQLAHVSCGPDGTCAADGTVTADGDQEVVLWAWGSGRWTVTQAPLPAGGDHFGNANGAPILNGVSCGEGVCADSGTYVDTSGGDDTVLWALDNGAWAATEAPLPNAAPDVWSPDLSCGGTVCAGYGGYSDPDGGPGAALWTLAGGVWAVAVPPLPGPGRAIVVRGAFLRAERRMCRRRYVLRDIFRGVPVPWGFLGVPGRFLVS